MSGNVCLFKKYHNPSKWKSYGAIVHDTVTYSKLLGQKRGFQQFIEFNDKISNSGRMDSYCIIDKRYSPSKGSNIKIFIFDNEDDHAALYLEYSVHQNYFSKNCNELITYLNFNKNSTFLLHNSFIYVKSAGRFKWMLFFGMLEFLVKNLNRSIIGSQFYFPLFSKYLIMNELRLMLTLQNWFKSLVTNFMSPLSQISKISALRLKKSLPSGASNSTCMLQHLKNKISSSSEQAVKKMNLNTYTCRSNQNLQLKRKSIDSYTENDCLPNNKRIKSEKNICHCKKNTWKIFASFQKISILNYASILESKKWANGSENMYVLPTNCSFQTDCMQNSNSFILHQNQNRLKQDHFSALDISEKFSTDQFLEKTIALKNITNLCLRKTEENLSIYEHTSDVHTFKVTESASHNREHSTFDNMGSLQLSALKCQEEECKNGDIYSKTTSTDKSEKHIASPSGGHLPKTDFIGIKELSVTFQTGSGKPLKISEAALQAAEKIFEDISSENLDFFPQKKTQNALQLKSADKYCVGFRTASGKSLHASKVALETAEKLLKEINVEEIDLFPEKQTQTKQKNDEFYPSLKECVDDDISKDLAENFFEDITFDEKGIDSKPIDDSVALNLQKSETAKIAQTHKRKKSLGGRRTLKPYTLKK